MFGLCRFASRGQPCPRWRETLAPFFANQLSDGPRRDAARRERAPPYRERSAFCTVPLRPPNGEFLHRLRDEDAPDNQFESIMQFNSILCRIVWLAGELGQTCISGSPRSFHRNSSSFGQKAALSWPIWRRQSRRRRNSGNWMRLRNKAAQCSATGAAKNLSFLVRRQKAVGAIVQLNERHTQSPCLGAGGTGSSCCCGGGGGFGRPQQLAATAAAAAERLLTVHQLESIRRRWSLSGALASSVCANSNHRSSFGLNLLRNSSAR